MDAIKIVNKIKEQAKSDARKNGQDEYAYALGAVGAHLELAIRAIKDGDTQFFLNRMKQFEEE